jgi:hypothetical protein
MVPTRPISLTAGYPAKFDLPVRNIGTGPATGAVMSLLIDTRFLATKSYRNCTVDDLFLHCTFDTTLEPHRYYGLSEPLTLRTPADSITGSVVRTAVTWWTTAEYEALPQLPPEDGAKTDPERPPYIWISEPVDPRWGAAPELRLKELAGPPDAPPPAKVWDDFLEEWVDAEPELDMTVVEGRSADLAISGVRTVTPDGRGTVRVTLTNHGPGRLYPSLYPNNSLNLVSTFPGGEAVAAPERCWLPPEGTEVQCSSTTSIGRGEHETLDIGVRVAKTQAGPGLVQIEMPAIDDPDRSNDEAPIVTG